MVENSYVKFLDLLIMETKLNKIGWSYLDTNKNLIKNMGWCTTSVISQMFAGEAEPIFNTEDSFFAQSGDTAIVIYVKGDNPASLYVIPSTYKKIVHLGADEYGGQITRLLNLVQSKFPNADQFISDFIHDRIEEV